MDRVYVSDPQMLQKLYGNSITKTMNLNIDTQLLEKVKRDTNIKINKKATFQPMGTFVPEISSAKPIERIQLTLEQEKKIKQLRDINKKITKAPNISKITQDTMVSSNIVPKSNVVLEKPNTQNVAKENIYTQIPTETIIPEQTQQNTLPTAAIPSTKSLEQITVPEIEPLPSYIANTIEPTELKSSYVDKSIGTFKPVVTSVDNIIPTKPIESPKQKTYVLPKEVRTSNLKTPKYKIISDVPVAPINLNLDSIKLQSSGTIPRSQITSKAESPKFAFPKTPTKIYSPNVAIRRPETFVTRPIDITEQTIEDKTLSILKEIDKSKLNKTRSSGRATSGYTLNDIKQFAKRLGITISNKKKEGIIDDILNKMSEMGLE